MNGETLLKKYLLRLIQKEDFFSLLTVWVIQNPVSFSIIALAFISAITFLVYYYIKKREELSKAKEINFEALIKYVLDIKSMNEDFIFRAEASSKELKNKIDKYMKDDMNLDNDVKRSIDMLSNSISMLVKVLTNKEK
jgi:hypothetical protein